MTIVGILLSALAVPQSGDARIPPPATVDWRRIDTGASAGAILELYVEKTTMRTVNETRFAWILATLDTSQSPYRYKKELMAIDCARSRYEGVRWVWAGLDERIFHSEDGDVNWIPVLAGSPAESIMRFVCAQP